MPMEWQTLQKAGMSASTRASSLLLLAAAAGVGMAAMWSMRAQPPNVELQSAPMISLEKMGHLVSVKINYSDVVEFSEKRVIDLPMNREIPLGSAKVLLVARGDCTIATNLAAAQYQDVDRATKVLTVVLPMPELLQVRINHASRDKGGSYFYSITSDGIEAFAPDSDKRTKAVTTALANAQKTLERVCMAPPNVLSARQNAESVLRAMYVAAGWTPTFAWK